MQILLLFLLGLLLSIGKPLTSDTLISGTVFHDKNENGQKDSGESGIAGVVISDQISTTRTDNKGQFQLAVKDKRFDLIFISLPNGFKGKMWQKAAKALSFPLRESKVSNKFTFIHASDTHIDSSNLPRMQKFRKMAETLQPEFVIITGDLVRDALRVNEEIASEYYKMYVKEIEQFSMPVYSGVGNHELFGIERDKSLVSSEHPLYAKGMYRHFLGPNYYSFNYGGLHFVSIDGVQHKNLYYYGGIDSLQLDWLSKDLKHLDQNTPLVVFNHIPLMSPGFSFQEFEGNDYYGPSLLKINGKLKHRHVVENYEDLKAVIGDRPFPLALSGHYHAAQEGRFTGSETLFAQTSAIGGPDAFKFQGFDVKSGFTIYEVEDGKIVKSTFVPLDLPN